jgi:hypothetical protein
VQIFGPVLSVGVFKTEDEAIALANNTTYGLGAGLHSSMCLIDAMRPWPNPKRFIDNFPRAGDANQCMRVSSALEAGTVSHSYIPFLSTFSRLSKNVLIGVLITINFLLIGLGQPIQYSQ